MTTTSMTWTFDPDSATFGVGSMAVSGTLTNTVPTTISTSAIATDTSLPPSRASAQPASTTSSVRAATTTASYEPSTGQTIGITVGVAVGAILLICLIFIFCWKWRLRAMAKRKAPKIPLSTDRASQPFELPAPRYSSYQSAWPTNVNPAEIGVAVTSAKRKSFRQKLTTSKPKPQSRSFLPISAPVLAEGQSIRESFQDRFFTAPTPVRQSEAIPAKHVSDATTIRTSCNPSTPGRPPIAVLRPWSTATSFEEDRDHHHPSDIPPLPTFTAVEVPLRSMSVKRKQGKPARLDLEAGIKKNLNKATSYMPMTPMYDNGNVDFLKKPAIPIIPRTKLKTSRSTEMPTQYSSRAMTTSEIPAVTTPTRRPNASPTTQYSPHVLFLDDPERESSGRNFNMRSDEERLLSGTTRASPQYSRENTLRPAPLTIKRSGELAVASPVRNLMYPNVPASASGTHFGNQTSLLKSPFAARPALNATVSADNITRYTTNPPRPPDNPFEGWSSMNDDDRSSYSSSGSPPPFPTRSPFRIAAGEGRMGVYSSSHYVPPPRATLTPNRTNTGDLVLTVDM